MADIRLDRLRDEFAVARADSDALVVMHNLKVFTASDLYSVLGHRLGKPYREHNKGAHWSNPVSELVAAYNTARDEMPCAPVKQIIARARAAEAMPWVVSGES